MRGTPWGGRLWCGVCPGSVASHRPGLSGKTPALPPPSPFWDEMGRGASPGRFGASKFLVPHPRPPHPSSSRHVPSPLPSHLFHSAAPRQTRLQLASAPAQPPPHAPHPEWGGGEETPSPRSPRFLPTSPTRPQAPARQGPAPRSPPSIARVGLWGWRYRLKGGCRAWGHLRGQNSRCRGLEVEPREVGLTPGGGYMQGGGGPLPGSPPPPTPHPTPLPAAATQRRLLGTPRARRTCPASRRPHLDPAGPHSPSSPCSLGLAVSLHQGSASQGPEQRAQ